MTNRDDLQLDGFETRLLTELKAAVDARAPQTAPTRQPAAGRRQRRLWYLPVTGAAAAVAIAVALAVTLASPTPAYAVTGRNGEEITVTVTRLEGADALQAALRDRGVPSDIQYLPSDMQCLPGRYTDVSPRGLALDVGSNFFRVTIPAGAIGRGDTFVLSAAVTPFENGQRAVVDFGIAQGAVTTCEVVPAS